MKTCNTWTWPTLIYLVLAIFFSQPSYSASPSIRPISIESDHIYGSIEAPVSIIMYSDFFCPYCKKLRLTLKKLVNQSSGRINWVYRHFPLEGDDSTNLRQANAIECTSKMYGNEQFWTLTQTLFNLPNNRSENVDNLIALAAQKSNINAESLLQCINSNRYKKLIQQDQQEAKKLGLTGTPGVVFINNKNNKTIVKQGALSYANLNKFIRSVTDHSILLTH